MPLLRSGEKESIVHKIMRNPSVDEVQVCHRWTKVHTGGNTMLGFDQQPDQLQVLAQIGRRRQDPVEKPECTIP